MTSTEKFYDGFRIIPHHVSENSEFSFISFLNYFVKIIKQVLLECLNWWEEGHVPEGNERGDRRRATGSFAGRQLLSLIPIDINMQPLAINGDLALHHLCENRWTLLPWAGILAMGSHHCHKIPKIIYRAVLQNWSFPHLPVTQENGVPFRLFFPAAKQCLTT